MISLSASTEVQQRTPVSCSMRAHKARSASKPNQPEEVPFQAITSTFASASSKAASTMGCSANWLKACDSSEIAVTRKRAKCTETSGRPASIAEVSGSSAVFEDGVSMPRRTRFMSAP